VVIPKSEGVTPTERLLARLCEKTFLRLWSYPNPFKDDGKELCDLIAVFESHIFVFFDRESRKFDNTTKDISITWRRWKNEVIEKQIKTANGAEKYLSSGRQVYLDQKHSVEFPIPFSDGMKIHKFIVAHGAREACEAFSDQNVYGSLGVCYGKSDDGIQSPFLIELNSNEKIHLLDTHNLEIVFNELDTFYDFCTYVQEKERAIDQYNWIMYCGEEDLLAHYFLNFNEDENSYKIGVSDETINGLMIGEGEWKDFVERGPYQRRKEANKDSYLWDDIIQRTCENALDGTLLGDAGLLKGKSAIHEMAKEPRFSRRALSAHIRRAIHSFPNPVGVVSRHLACMPSFFKNKMFVFLQLHCKKIDDYENEYRPKRRALLELACGVTKNKFPHINKVVGIAIDAPKFSSRNSEDFILLECAEWPEENRKHYEDANKGIDFLESDTNAR